MWYGSWPRMIAQAPDRDIVLLTGATGFLGQYVLSELLRQNRRCGVLVRPPRADSLDRLAGSLWGLGLDVRQLMAEERLIGLEGDLCSDLPRANDVSICSVVHAAAVTHFHSDAKGEPARTNVGGTRRLLEWAAARGVDDFHLVSSAYVCGRAGAPVPEAFDPSPPPFHNDYERSKWDAERLCEAWACDSASRRLTVYRPSVVVGEYGSGRSARFSGLA